MNFIFKTTGEPTIQEVFKHAVSCFHYLMLNNQMKQSYTARELAEAIRTVYSETEPRISYILACLDLYPDKVFLIHNYSITQKRKYKSKTKTG